jgi:sterol desaturase/sphingolipid hydroxylase (fatty acid hydroxylase superfamily)
MNHLDTNAYYALGIPAYFILIALEYFSIRKKGLHVYDFSCTIGNFSCGLGEIVIGFFLGPLLFMLYDFTYRRFALLKWPDHSIIPWVIAFFVSDLCYYIYHRAGHSVGILWAIHGVHHQAEEMNVTVAMRHPWLSDLYSAIFYFPLPLLGVTPVQFFVSISVISFYALTVHSRTFNRPTLFIFVTPKTHLVHHSTNPRYIGNNLGAMFTLWDRLFGTHVEIVQNDQPKLGTLRGYRTHNGALSQWNNFSDLLSAARLTNSWRDKIKIFFAHPGWLPSGITLPVSITPQSSVKITPITKIYIGLQFAIMAFAAVYVILHRDALGLMYILSISAILLWGTASLGGMLDGKSWAKRWEFSRLLATVLFVFWMTIT